MLKKEKKDTLINFRVTSTQKELIEGLCSATGENQSQLIMRLIFKEITNVSRETKIANE